MIQYPYLRDLLRRHYEYLEREHAKLSADEATRTRIEGENALYLADLVALMPKGFPDGFD